MQIKIIKSKRKSFQMKIENTELVTVRVPLKAGDAEVEDFIKKHSLWLIEHLAKMKIDEMAMEKAGFGKHHYTEAEIRKLTEAAKKTFKQKADRFAPILGVDYGRISVKRQKTRFGSCSSKGNLNFNLALLFAPDEVVDYVVVHELCHRKEMNHSARFYSEVKKVLPDYKKAEKWLKENGKNIIKEINN